MAQLSGRSQALAILQFLLSLGGFGLCALAAAGALGFGALAALVPTLGSGDAAQWIGLSWVFAILSLLALPSLWFSFRALSGRALPTFKRGQAAASAALMAWPLILAGGALLARQGAWAAYLLPPLSAAAAGIPLWWLIEMLRHRLGELSPRRAWGALNFVLFVSTPAAMLLELLLVLGLSIGGVALLVSLDSGLAPQIQQLGQRLVDAQGDSTLLQELLLPLLSNPWVIFAALVFFALLVPLLEELCKTLGLWVLLGLEATPAQGLVLGAISGAGFGLAETLFNLASPAVQSQWLALAVGRAGTNLLHITASALLGWGLVSAWRAARFERLALAYAAAVLLHGAWNALSLLSALLQLAPAPAALTQALPYTAFGGLALLGLLCAVILLAANLRLRKPAQTSPLET